MQWIWFTLLAASMQAGRNAFQKQLSRDVPVLGVTLARFLFAVPFALGYLILLYQTNQSYQLPQFTPAFYLYILGASIAQILATALMVKLFHLKNYAIGVGLAKSEAILAAILGVTFFGSQISLIGWFGVFIGAIAIFMMTGAGQIRQISWKTLLIGVGSGLSFALTSLWVREASLQLNTHYLLSAAWVLFSVISVEAVLLVAYLSIRERETLVKLFRHPKLAIATSVFSFLGSFGWFNAMSLQHVAFVKTVGQIEVLFMLLISFFIFKEKLKRVDLWGLILIVIAALLVMWG
ncbi:multidrug transporter [Pasteurellaceae bacterium 15-036681]|nr:multidrug transporter [Pasteurellaceae bacterium 15-036681]